MRITKTMAISGTLVAAGLTGLVGTHAAHAASDPQDGQAGWAGGKTTSMYYVNKGNDQEMSSEDRQAKEADHLQMYTSRVNQAVKDGTLTQDLADQLVAKQKEFASYRDTLQGQSMTDRMSAMKSKMDEFVQWAQANNIPQNLWPMGMRFGMHMQMTGSYNQ